MEWYDRTDEPEFADFLQKLLDWGLSGALAGIARVMMDKGVAALSKRQRYAFDNHAMGMFYRERCTSCFERLKWSEMFEARYEGWKCSCCLQRHRSARFPWSTQNGTYVMGWKDNIDDDFPCFVQELLDAELLDKTSASLARLVVQRDLSVLNEKQRSEFENAIGEFVTAYCSSCLTPIPWSEMYEAYDHGGLCVRCAA